MNKREALRWAAGELADLATERSEDYGDTGGGGAIPQEDWTRADVQRIVWAFAELGARMETLATGVRRSKARPARIDPNQVPLFE